MNICFITQRYPGAHNTTDYAFVKQLVDAIAKLGNCCYVLAPFNITHYRSFSRIKEEYSIGEGSVTVYRPGYLSFSTWHLGKFSPTSWFYKKAIKKALRLLKVRPDFMYGHFWSSAFDGYEFARKRNIPLFVASGESEITESFSFNRGWEEFAEYVRGVICVSSKNREESIRLGLTTDNKCGVFPNAINAELFHKYNKEVCRKKLCIPDNCFIVAFVGWFNERKGSQRLSAAIDQLEDVKSFFIGKGELEPKCEGILYKGALPHEEIPIYLGAADCFVLPTLHEGCCNAVIEAMACGLPVVSSNLPFNWDVLDDTNSILIDPRNIDEMANAISTLKENKEKRNQLAEGALKKAEDLTIDKRAKAIMEFIKDKIQIE